MGLLGVLSFAPLAQADNFRLVTAPFKPFTDPDHPKGGFLVEIATEALALRGHQLSIEYRPWARALSDAENGRYDGILSAFYNEERAEKFHFSAPLNTTKMVFVGLRKKMTQTHYNTLSDLKDYTIGVGRKWAYSEEFAQNTELKKSIVNDEPSGIRMLFSERIDLFAVNIDQFHKAISELPDYVLDETYVLDPAISINDHHIAASRQLPNSEKFLAEFNTGLAALKASGRYRAIKTEFFGF
jgi:polar amino acid transport system substrate-binding protein